ncbi:hypothetical protein SAMN06295973_0962 [Plantibacter cousiniae]|uniref:Uncharacterized protein n=1 Tax=Plantibacter cousiniae (nom. nud.) TaxID=199709 RepID=A0ABY1LL11_9MICO|nr:hypothetical protein SAMN06295973_0962 [Plantibacter cousiniae]
MTGTSAALEAITTRTATGSGCAGTSCGTTARGSNAVRNPGVHILPPTPSTFPSEVMTAPAMSGRPNCSSAADEANTTSEGLVAGPRPRTSRFVEWRCLTGTRVPSGLRVFRASSAVENAPAHSMPSVPCNRTRTSVVTPASGSARITMARDSIELIEARTRSSAPTARPVVTKTAKTIAATVNIVRMLATGLARAVASASRATARPRLIAGALGRSGQRALWSE